MKQKITEKLFTDDILEEQYKMTPKELVKTNGYLLGYVSQNSRLARRIKAGKTNGKKYKHIDI